MWYADGATKEQHRSGADRVQADWKEKGASEKGGERESVCSGREEGQRSEREGREQ